MNQYRILALDLDDTTLNEKKEISIENKKWIKRAIDSGVRVIFATGRSVLTAEKYWKELNLNTPLVLVNGAEIWSEPGTLLNQHFICENSIARLHKLAIQEQVEHWGYNISKSAKNNHKWLSFIIRSNNTKKLNRLRLQIESWDTVQVTSSKSDNLEISAKGITKETGLKEVCDLLGASMKEVIAIGDNHNDIHLIRSAGLGIAMENSVDELKEVADVITYSNRDNGVARAIRKYLFKIKEDPKTNKV